MTPTAENTPVLRVGNASGFYGDRIAAVREMLTGGELDVLTGDYLAELTMLILGRDRLKDPSLGYAKTFLRQMEEGLGLALDRGVKIVVNAGGLNPGGLADKLRELADRLGVNAQIAHVRGDDLVARAAELQFGSPAAANAYLGAFGIAEGLKAGADVVVTGRITDASLVVGPAIWRFGWDRTDYDQLAGAVVAGHLVECGTQVTGGNYAFFQEVLALNNTGLDHVGFPIAEIHADGTSVITKHPGTGGAVTVGTVTAQLLYEIQGARYAGPDVTTRLDTVELAQDGPDRVRVSGVRGEPPPPTLKVSLNTIGGFRNEMTFIITGLDVDAKAALVRQQLESLLVKRPAEVIWTLARVDRPDAPTQQQASALLQCVVRDPDPEKVGRQFSSAAVELALASYPGFALTTPPGNGSPYGVFTAGFVPQTEVSHEAVLPDGTVVAIPPAPKTRELADVPEPIIAQALMPKMRSSPRRLPLGAVVGARSGDKGGSANIGVWVRTDEQYDWLVGVLTVEKFKELLPEAADLVVRRTFLYKLRAINFVVEGILGRGVAEQARFDPQAKGLGEWLRSREVDIPEEVL